MINSRKNKDKGGLSFTSLHQRCIQQNVWIVKSQKDEVRHCWSASRLSDHFLLQLDTKPQVVPNSVPLVCEYMCALLNATLYCKALLVVSRRFSINLEGVQTKIANRKQARRKHISFKINLPYITKRAHTFAWGGISGNSKTPCFTKLQWKHLQVTWYIYERRKWLPVARCSRRDQRPDCIEQLCFLGSFESTVLRRRSLIFAHFFFF